MLLKAKIIFGDGGEVRTLSKEKGLVEQTIQAEQSTALMDWADDGGLLPRHHPDSRDKLK
jgi:hypothetical protein